MVTILFVHGTGVREPYHSQVFTQEIKKPLKALQRDLKVEACFWGGKYGAKLNAAGASIPKYDTTRGAEYTEKAIALWEQLYRDPFYELRALSVASDEVPGLTTNRFGAAQELTRRVKMLPVSLELQNKLDEAGITEEFMEARSTIVSSMIYLDAIQTASSSPSTQQIAIARAIVAEAVMRCKKKEKYAAIITDAELRDDVVQLVFLALGGKGHKMRDWLLEKLFGVVGTVWAEPHRGAITDYAYPLAGDILFYQRHGESIRMYISNDIKKVDPPVILLAHSLGGVACVDLLVQQPLNHLVPLLITVGSQAPFFYEIDALPCLAYKLPLPSHFPKWLNIYDQRDLLAFVGEKVFEKRVVDVPVDNDQPFPQAHGAYWRNKDTWSAIVNALVEVLR